MLWIKKQQEQRQGAEHNHWAKVEKVYHGILEKTTQEQVVTECPS